MKKLHVSELISYPLKSARGLSSNSLKLNSKGPNDDRRWMVVNRQHAFVTQRTSSKMCLIDIKRTDNGIQLSAPNTLPCDVAQPFEGIEVDSSVWGSDVKGIDCGDRAAAWLSDFLSQACRLIFMPDTFIRPVDTRFASKQEQVAFADGFPLLIATQASLNDFNNKLGYAVSMERFRPNIVISGNAPWAEDDWKTLIIGDVEFTLAKPCARCIMPSINPKSGEKEMAVIKAMQEHRRIGTETFFGQNAVYDRLGTIHIGDEVLVIN